MDRRFCHCTVVVVVSSHESEGSHFPFTTSSAHAQFKPICFFRGFPFLPSSVFRRSRQVVILNP